MRGLSAIKPAKVAPILERNHFVHVFVGGLLLVGVVAILWGVASEMVFAEAHGGQPLQPTRLGVPVAMALTYLIGVIVIWIYASISTRLGRGLRSAVIAALGVWIVVYMLQT